MTSVRFYSFVFAVLMFFAVTQELLFRIFDYWAAVGIALAVAAIKTGLVVGYFQHLRHEPRSLTYLVVSGVVLVLLLMSAATFSIT